MRIIAVLISLGVLASCGQDEPGTSEHSCTALLSAAPISSLPISAVNFPTPAANGCNSFSTTETGPVTITLVPNVAPPAGSRVTLTLADAVTLTATADQYQFERPPGLNQPLQLPLANGNLSAVVVPLAPVLDASELPLTLSVTMTLGNQ